MTSKDFLAGSLLVFLTSFPRFAPVHSEPRHIVQTHPLCPHMQLPVIPHPHQLELRAYSMEPHGISSKLLQCRQGHDAYPEIWRGNHQNSGWLAGRRVLVIPPGPPFSSSCYPPAQGLAHGICG